MLYTDETLDELVEALMLEIIEGLTARLVFEAWADAREADSDSV